MPFCSEGLEATHALTADGIPVNMTLVFSANQALLAAGAGATYVSCFMGRLDDISVDSGQVVAEIVECFRAGGVTSQIISASIRHPEHIVTSAQLGCEIATVPAKVLRQMLDHPLTDRGRRPSSRPTGRPAPSSPSGCRGLVEARSAANSSAGRTAAPGAARLPPITCRVEWPTISPTRISPTFTPARWRRGSRATACSAART